MTSPTSTRVAGLSLKNPVMAGAGEATMNLSDMKAAIDAGAAAVVAKSTNESGAARRQLEVAEYLRLDENWRPLPDGPVPRSASFFCRSGLVDESFDRWLEILVEADAYAFEHDAYVVASLIVADPDVSAELAARIEAAGLRWLELNLGPPYRGETPAGAIRSEVDTEVVQGIVDKVRRATDLPLTVKLTSQGDPLASSVAAVAAGADAVCLTGRYPAFLPDLETRLPMLGTFGAIGGAWSLPLSLRWIAKARAQLGPDAPLIGTNGARDGYDVIRFVLSGASAVQMTTVVVTDGPQALTTALEQVTEYLDAHEVDIESITGEAADQVRSIASLLGDPTTDPA